MRQLGARHGALFIVNDRHRSGLWPRGGRWGPTRQGGPAPGHSPRRPARRGPPDRAHTNRLEQLPGRVADGCDYESGWGPVHATPHQAGTELVGVWDLMCARRAGDQSASPSFPTAGIDAATWERSGGCPGARQVAVVRAVMAGRGSLARHNWPPAAGDPAGRQAHVSTEANACTSRLTQRRVRPCPAGLCLDAALRLVWLRNHAWWLVEFNGRDPLARKQLAKPRSWYRLRDGLSGHPSLRGFLDFMHVLLGDSFLVSPVPSPRSSFVLRCCVDSPSGCCCPCLASWSVSIAYPQQVTHARGGRIGGGRLPSAPSFSKRGAPVISRLALGGGRVDSAVGGIGFPFLIPMFRDSAAAACSLPRS